MWSVGRFGYLFFLGVSDGVEFSLTYELKKNVDFGAGYWPIRSVLTRI